jgi:hypothetical protein
MPSPHGAALSSRTVHSQSQGAPLRSKLPPQDQKLHLRWWARLADWGLQPRRAKFAVSIEWLFAMVTQSARY